MSMRRLLLIIVITISVFFFSFFILFGNFRGDMSCRGVLQCGVFRVLEIFVLAVFLESGTNLLREKGNYTGGKSIVFFTISLIIGWALTYPFYFQ